MQRIISFFLGVSLVILCVTSSTSLFAQGSKPFLLKAGTVRGAVQWEQSVDKTTWSDVPGGNVATFMVQPTKTTYYRARVTEPDCVPTYSDIKAVVIESGFNRGAVLIKGEIALPAGSTINKGELTVLSFLDSTKINTDGTFELLMADSIASDYVIVTNKQGEVLLMCYVIGKTQTLEINAQSTALATLLIYPFLKPLDATEKAKLVALYKTDADLKPLVQEVDQLLLTGKPLFSLSNTGLIKAMNTMLLKDYNSDRLKKPSTAKIFADPISILSKTGGKVTIKNNTSYHYAGGIYDNKEGILRRPFKVSGTIGTSNALAKYFNYIQTNEEIKREIDIDLKALGLGPGEYEIRLRSGMASDDSREDGIAIRENYRELFVMIYGNILPSPGELMVGQQDGIVATCVSSAIDDYLSAIPTKKLIATLNDTKLMEELMDKFFTKDRLITRGCIVNGILSIFNERIKQVLKFIEASLPIAYYLGDLALNKAAVDGCQYLDAELESYNCFVIELVDEANVKPYYYSGDSVELKLRSIKNEDYYPYEKGPYPFAHFVWLTTTGTFAPDNALNPKGRTDVNGLASILWRLPCTASANNVKVFIPGIPETLTEEVYVTTTKNVFIAQGSKDVLQGKPNEPVNKEITITVKDPQDGLLMPLKYFDIQWSGDGKITLVKSGGIYNTYRWTLGPTEGTQEIRATIKSTTCDWKMEENPLIFKATTLLDTLAVLRSKQWQLTNGPITHYTTNIYCPGLKLYAYELTAATLNFQLVNGQTVATESRTGKCGIHCGGSIDLSNCIDLTKPKDVTGSNTITIGVLNSEFQSYAISPDQPGELLWLLVRAKIVSLTKDELIIQNSLWWSGESMIFR